MRKYIHSVVAIIISIATSFSIQAKTVYVDEHTKILEGLDGDKIKLFGDSKKWAANNFNSAKDVIQYESLDEGKLIIRAVSSPLCDSTVGRLQCGGYSQAKISFNITIDLKDNRARLKFGNLGYANFGDTPIDDPITYKLMINRFEFISDNFKKTISTATTDDNW